jgi:tetratricopeptide (TPR) repeat protein
MPEASKKNPIEQRLDYLSGLWNEFAKDPEPRLLRWLVDDDGIRMVELLIEMQNEEVGDIPDLFIRFEAPFTDAKSYPLELLKSLSEQYEESRKDIAEEGLPAGWQCPPPQSRESSVQAFARACASFRKYYRGKMLALALFLAPSRISNLEDWQKFLLALLRCGLPPTIRITVIDHIGQPKLNELCEAEPKLTRTITPELDMPGALEEIAETAEGVGPGNDFRKLFVKLGNAAAQGNIKAANKVATAALRIARKQKWFDLQVAVHMVLGAMHLGKGATAEAIAVYRQAGKLAVQAEQSGHPAGRKLVVQTRFAEAGVLLGEGKYQEAAPLYEETVPLARAQDEAFLELEAWRMASYCYEMAKRPREAWRCGNQALETGERLDEELRPNSTLPYVGQQLLALLARQRAGKKYEQQVRQRMVALVGKDWEERLQPGGAAA